MHVIEQSHETYAAAADILESTAAQLSREISTLSWDQLSGRNRMREGECEGGWESAPSLTQASIIAQQGPIPPRRRRGNQDDLDAVEALSGVGSSTARGAGGVSKWWVSWEVGE